MTSDGFDDSAEIPLPDRKLKMQNEKWFYIEMCGSINRHFNRNERKGKNRKGRHIF